MIRFERMLWNKEYGVLGGAFCSVSRWTGTLCQIVRDAMFVEDSIASRRIDMPSALGQPQRIGGGLGKGDLSIVKGLWAASRRRYGRFSVRSAVKFCMYWC